MRKVLLLLCCLVSALFAGIRDDLAKMPDEAVEIVYEKGAPYFKIGDTLYPPVLYNYSDAGKYDKTDFTSAVRGFVDGGIKLISFGIDAEYSKVNGKGFWYGPNQYNYKVVDDALQKAFTLAPEGRFIFAITFCHGPNWWNTQYPEEQIKYARIDKDTPADDCIGNYVCHSFGSERWRKDASETVRKLVAYIESTPYAKHIFGYRIGDGVYSEWVQFGMEAAMPDVGPAMTKYFRKYLREKYNGNEEKLRQAWKQPGVTFDKAAPPPVNQRMKYINGTLLRDPRNAWCIDFLQCMQCAARDLLLSMNKAAKEACGGRKLIGNYCGYFYNQGYTANGWQLMTDDLMDSPYVDFLIAPTCYTGYYRNVGSSQLARNLVASYPLHNKLCIIEADTRTHLTNPKDGSRRVQTAQESVASLSRDMAQAISRGCAYWYYDLGRMWYNCPEILDFFKKIAPVYEAVKDFTSSAEIAVIADWESVYYHAIQYMKDDKEFQYTTYNGGFQTYASINFVPLAMSKAGLVFDTFSFADVDNPALDKYKVYVFPQLYYMTPEKLAKLDALKKAGKTLIFLNQAGWLTPNGPDAESVYKTTGIHADVLKQKGNIPVTLKNGVVMDGNEYGLKYCDIFPLVKINDAEATVLGTVKGEEAKVDTYAKKVGPNGPTTYLNGSPFISTPELRRIAQEAGVHIYCDSDKGVVYANNSMISFHTGTPGEYTLKAKEPVKWTMVYPEKRSATKAQSELTFTASKPETYIFMIEP